MEGDDRWATPVPRPGLVCSRRVRRNSIPARLHSTRTELQLDEGEVFLSNASADRESHHGANHHLLAATGQFGADSDWVCSRFGTAAHGAIRTELTIQGRAGQSKSFSGGDLARPEGSDQLGSLVVRGRSVSDDSQGSSRGTTDNSTWSASLTDPGKHLWPHRPVTVQAAEEALPGSRERRRPGSLLKQRGWTSPALNIDGTAARPAHNHASSSSPSRADTSGEAASRRPPPASAAANFHRRTRRLSSAGESASSAVLTAGSHPRDASSGRSRRKSTSVLPSITDSSSAASTAAMATRKGPAATGAGRLQSRSLPEERSPDGGDDVNAMHANLLPLTRKKKISTKVSEEYRRVLDDLRISHSSSKPTPPPAGKRLLSQRWTSLQSSVLAKNDGSLRRTGWKDRSSVARVPDKKNPRDGKLQHASDDANNNDPGEPRRGRGWEIVRAKLTVIADMAPKDSIDSKPLTFRNIADLVKAKEFRLMMKRRASFVENGRFQFDEAKRDLYRRYGGRAGGHLPPAAPPENHSSHGRKTDGGPETGTRVVNRRKLLGLSESF